MLNKQAQGDLVHPLAPGKRKGFAHETAQALAQGTEPAFGVAGLTFGLATQAMSAPGKGFFVGEPEEAAGGAATVLGRDALTQGTGLWAERSPTKNAAI